MTSKNRKYAAFDLETGADNPEYGVDNLRNAKQGSATDY